MDSHVCFECTAVGTSIEIIWYYNGNQYSQENDDCLTQSVCVGTTVTTTVAFTVVNSKLEILLALRNGTVNCTVQDSSAASWQSSVSSLTVLPGTHVLHSYSTVNLLSKDSLGTEYLSLIEKVVFSWRLCSLVPSFHFSLYYTKGEPVQESSDYDF